MNAPPAADPAIPTHPARAVVHRLADALALGGDPSRIYGLDILRAVAITDVVVQHGSYLLPPGPAAVVRTLNLDGVSMFFVLSGFLVGGILVRLFERHRADVGLVLHFWIRRWFRTLPAYYVVLLVLCGLNTFHTPGFHPASTARYFVFAQNLHSTHPWFFPEAWSLCVEEWFYLLVPVIVLLMIRLGGLSPRAAITGTAVVVIVACTAFRAWRQATIDVHSLADWDDLFRKQVVTRLDSLMFGVLAAAISIHHRRAWVDHKWQAWWCGLGLMALGPAAVRLRAIPVGGTFSTVFSFTWASVSTALLLPLLAEYRHGKGLVHRCVTAVSLVSYSLYLLNLSVVQFWILGRRNAPPPAGDDLFTVLGLQVAYIVTLLTLSALMYRFVELPATGLRDHPWLRWPLPPRQGGGFLACGKLGSADRPEVGPDLASRRDFRAMTDRGIESRPVPTITVIVPTLDSAGTIVGCLESLASQTYRDVEVLIQDGLSADATVATAEAFRGSHPQLDLRVHQERDGGVYDAMNRALDRARGEWILFLGSDDRLFAPDTLERMAAHLSEDRDVVYGDVVSPVFGGRYAGRVSIRGLLDSNICHQAILVRRRLFDRVGKFDVRFRILADWEHNMRWFLSPDVRVSHVDEVIATFGERGLSSTGVDPVFHKEQRLLYLEHGRHSLPLGLKIRIAAWETVAAAVRCDRPRFLRAVRAWSAVLSPRRPIHR